MAELRNVDVEMISIVKKAANNRKFAIFKSAQSTNSEGNMSFADKIKGIFGSPAPVAKSGSEPVEKSEAEKVLTFDDKFAVNLWFDKGWELRSALDDTLYAIIVSKAENKAELIRQACAQMAEAVIRHMSFAKGEGDTGRSAEQIADFVNTFKVEKAGKAVSAKNLGAIKSCVESLKTGLSALEEFIGTHEVAETPEGVEPIHKSNDEEEPMSQEKLDQILAGLADFNTRLTVVEKSVKGESDPAPETTGDNTNPEPKQPEAAPVEKSATEIALEAENARLKAENDGKLDQILKSMADMSGRVGAIEKSAGLPNGSDLNGAPVEKSGSDDAGSFANSPFLADF